MLIARPFRFGWVKATLRVMADSEKAPATLLDDLAALDPPKRREVAKELRKVSETFAEVPDGRTASHVLGVLAEPAATLPDLPVGPVPKMVILRNRGW